MSLPRTLPELLERARSTWPQACAVRAGELSWDFAELAERAERMAQGLLRVGVQPGERVAVVARNRADTVALYFAAARVGAVLMPLNYRLSAAELGWILRHCPPRVLCVEPDFAGRILAEDLAGTPADGRLLWDGERTGWRPVEALLAGPTEALDHAPVTASDPAVQMYTSGTTGRPKGAVLSHENILALTAAWAPDMHLSPGVSRFLQVTPLFHVGGMLMVMSTVWAGTELWLLPEFDPAAAIDTLSEGRITHTLMVPAMVRWCLLDVHLGERRFPALELMVYGAAPMPVSLLAEAAARFECAFLQGYGLTESAGVLLVLKPEDHARPAEGPAPERLASAGKAVGCAEVQVVDADGAPVAAGAIGEIVARGPNMTIGYFADPEATAEAFAGGWFHTGDLARVDAEGYVYVVDRSKDMILVGGENVYPREIEDVLLAHAAVADAAVIGIPHDVWGEQVLALVVPRSDQSFPGERALIRYCRSSLASFKCPGRIELRDDLGRNAAGKLQKPSLREPYWEGRSRRV